MRLSPTLVLLSAVAAAAAQEQVPLKDQLQGWLEKAKSLIPTAVASVSGSVSSAASNAATAAASTASSSGNVHEKDVVPIKLSNYEAVFGPASPDASQSEREWLVYITGGNKTCFGQCGRADEAWENALPLFSADPTSPSLGKIDCENEKILCNVWSTGPPMLWHIQRPLQSAPGELRGETPIHRVRMNYTTVTADDIYKVHSEKLWEEKAAFEGAFHPFDGWLAEYNLNYLIGYLVFGLSVVPSWLFMIGISFVSRTIM
ncbi:hypothetical protein AJ80_01000 [Polytolypa hystricis UAMH7299]|uniref:Peptidyl-tRNA hydrolase n=1 Tax=Polytolypa hystricis (strain UAMH7299) TaxID=1447883 RepID=A0A2B7Z1K9_POLH7|nr:hypothetical protein AJ80_01000 [Polytolypa hystricis UAMH7299]